MFRYTFNRAYCQNSVCGQTYTHTHTHTHTHKTTTVTLSAHARRGLITDLLTLGACAERVTVVVSCVCACLSVCLSVCPSVCVCLSVCLSVCPSVRRSVCPSVRPSVRPSVCLSEHAILAVRTIRSITKDAIMLSVRFAAILKTRFS